MAIEDKEARARSFGGVADTYDRGRPGWPAEAIDWLLGPEPLDVLDLGAGTGKLTAALVAGGHRVTALEPSAGMREVLAERLPEVGVVDGKAEELPFGDGSFDAFWATDPDLRGRASASLLWRSDVRRSRGIRRR